MAVRRVFCSYLSLLVNSKNDLALALTLDVPTRSLGRQAFTDIKHAAYDSKTSLFLVRNLLFYVFSPHNTRKSKLELKTWSLPHSLPNLCRNTFVFFFADCDLFYKSHPARREGLRSSRVRSTQETHQRPVRLCPVPRQPGRNTGGNSRPKVHPAVNHSLLLLGLELQP